MNATPEISWPSKEFSGRINIAATKAGMVAWRIELGLLAALIALLNLPQLTGRFAGDLVFLPEAVREGEWWRLLSHPFVHVSWYHLLLDAAAFFIAYVELRERRWVERVSVIAAAGAGSVLAAVWAAPLIFTRGLCGLSGVAHGLTAVVALEMWVGDRDRAVRWTGLACFAGVVLKSIVEALTGRVILEAWHLGSLGTPIAVCHAGGVIGALAWWMILRHPVRGK